MLIQPKIQLLKSSLEKERLYLEALYFKELTRFFRNESILIKASKKTDSFESVFFDLQTLRLRDLLQSLYSKSFTHFKCPLDSDLTKIASLEALRITANSRKRGLTDYIYPSRIFKIARTEANFCYNFVKYKIAISQGKTEKIWLSTESERHLSLAGNRLPITASFKNNVLFPGDIYGPTHEIIGCRCLCQYL